MSLLLEALKKAELAKQSADTHPAEPRHGTDPVITRDTLPDITQPLDIRANDLPSAGFPEGETPFGPAPIEVSSPSIPNRSDNVTPATDSLHRGVTAPTAAAAEGTDGQRAAARQIFEAKEADLPHPRRNFFLTLGALGIFAAGYGGYVWWQLQPRSLYNAATVAKTSGPSAAANAPPPVPAPSTSPAQSPTVTPDAPVPVVTGNAPATPASSAAAPATAVPSANVRQQGPASGGPSTPPTAVATSAPGRTREATPAPRASQASAPRSAPTPRPPGQGNAGAPIAVTPSTLAADPQIERAYEAFQLGDLPKARDQYQAVLQRDSANRDALLGLAAIDIRTRNYDLAESRYLRLLETDPRDAYAMAGLIALRGQTDPVQSESRLKSLIAAQPDVAHLHFALGNQYAVQSRWTEAQAAYFRAFTLDPDNPDFAFNLAVSLDQIRQGKLALDYYRRALALASARPASFEKNQVSGRITELSR